ncbi:hypothetical protein FOA52_012600 [Chlamydomonas sp. UWO 241]|nr:hypothetical protein FOA52_012600 [Chlamydomonas sp. UWO 241]
MVAIGAASAMGAVQAAGAVQEAGIDGDVAASNSGMGECQAESLGVLQWPEVCRQVACFCSTVMGVQRVVSGRLPIGRSQAESEALLRATAEAAEAGLSLAGVYDLRPALSAVASGYCLNARQLEGIAASLSAVLGAAEKVRETAPDGSPRFPELANLAAGVNEGERATAAAIQACIQVGYVTDGASEPLSAVRRQRAANRTALRTMMEEQARAAFAKGTSDSRSVSIMRGRYCIGIKAGRSGDLPKGSVKVGASQSGATHYYEPHPAIALNNGEAVLEEAEKKEEKAVLAMLTRRVESRALPLQSLLSAAADLDVAAARARHAGWARGARPEFVAWGAFEAARRRAGGGDGHEGTSGSGGGDSLDGGQGGSGGGGARAAAAAAGVSVGVSPLHVPGALHPLLLEPTLPKLPEPPSMDDNRFEAGFTETAGWEVRSSLVSQPVGGSSSSGSDSSAPRRPAPLDLAVPGGALVVAITGPNTGGKTVSLKTAGLAALMAKAGLYVPIESGSSGPGSVVRLLWFDQVLADIGDAQSLQQNLSTFSGHIRRVNAILASAGKHSLVLLDEVGSGTDPIEGAALARAVLDRLAGQAGLTLATTHHAELKTVATDDPRYVNVSMEFDVATLSPTYRLVWGSAGASNALDIAQALGFDGTVLKDARSVARALSSTDADRASKMDAVAASLEKQLAEAEADLEVLARKRAVADERSDALGEELREMAGTLDKVDRSPKLIAREVATYATELQTAVDAFGCGRLTQDDLTSAFARLEANIPDLVAQHNGVGTASDVRVGDTVWVAKSAREAKVTAVTGQYVFVAPADIGAAAFAFRGGSKRSTSGGAALRFGKEDVQLVRRASERTESGSAQPQPPQLPLTPEEEMEALIDAHEA